MYNTVKKVIEKANKDRANWGAIMDSKHNKEDWANIINEYARRLTYASQYDQGDIPKHLTSIASLAINALDQYRRRMDADYREINTSIEEMLIANDERYDVCHHFHGGTLLDIIQDWKVFVISLEPPITPIARLANYLCGLNGEIHEFLVEVYNGSPYEVLMKEAGDVIWYICAISRLIGVTPFKEPGMWLNLLLVDDEYRVNEPRDLPYLSGLFSETFKRQVFQGREVDDSVEHIDSIMAEIVLRLIRHIQTSMEPSKVTICKEQILQRIYDLNVQKLSARYPEGYSSNPKREE